MRSIIRHVVLVAGAILLCAVGTARASSFTVMEARVPFPFVVNGRIFPAGRYTVEREDTSSSVVLIKGERGNHAAAYLTTMPNGGHDPAGSQPALTFTRQENEFRLSGIWQSAYEGRDVVSR